MEMKEVFKKVYIGEEHPYLRPFICSGNPYEAKICFVGTNPATPIYPNQVKLEDYIKLLGNYDEFMNFYKESRKKEGKTEISRTRMGINAFKQWVKTEIGTNMIETDIFTYPTKNIKDLSKVDKDVLKQSLQLFEEVLEEYHPYVIILHGALTVETFNKLMNGKQIKYNSMSKKIEEIEKINPYAEMSLNGHDIKVLTSKHFMYYGKTGNCFQNLKNNLREIFKIKENSLEQLK